LRVTNHSDNASPVPSGPAILLGRVLKTGPSTALGEGVERIYEHVRDFADPERENVGTVPGFFNLILSNNEAIQRLFGREFGLSAKPHMRTIYDFYNKYRALYLKFKHGQGFVVV